MATNTIIVNPSAKPRVILRVAVVDLSAQELVFYDKIATTNADPRVRSEIADELITRLRPIYYK